MRVSSPISSVALMFSAGLSEEREASIFGLGRSWGMLSGPSVFYDADKPLTESD
jgi:hypothetical protein